MGRTRRQVLTLGTGALAGGLGTLYFTSQPAVAITSGLTADDVVVETVDGEISDLFVQPELTFEWSQFDHPVSSADIRLTTDGDQDGIAEVVADRETDVADGTAGSATYSFSEQVSLLANSKWDRSDFESTVEGETATQAVSLSLHVFLDPEQGYKVEGSASTEFQVSVTNVSGDENPNATATVSATANTGVLK